MDANAMKILAAAVLGGLGGMGAGLLLMDQIVEPESVPHWVIGGIFALVFVLFLAFVVFRRWWVSHA
jgi:integral membrane sensor domain MASE1